MRLATLVAVLVVRAFTVPLTNSSQLKANLKLPEFPRLFTLNEDESEKLPRSFMLPTGDCPYGWEDIGGVNCYKFFLGAYVTWVEARGACLLELGSDGYNADLASVHSQAEADLLAARVVSMNMNRPWIGMVRNQGRFAWTDGSARDFENWNNGEPNNWGGREDCAHIFTDWSGKWNDIACDKNLDYICMTSKRQRCAPTDCIDGFRYWRGRCYKFFESPAGRTWEQAEALCRISSNDRAALASISSSAENNFVANLFSYNSHLTAWLGGTFLRTNRWAWIDGNVWSGYTNWAEGQPNNYGGNDQVLVQDKIVMTGEGIGRGWATWGDEPSEKSVSGLVCKYRP